MRRRRRRRRRLKFRRRRARDSTWRVFCATIIGQWQCKFAIDPIQSVQCPFKSGNGADY